MNRSLISIGSVCLLSAFSIASAFAQDAKPDSGLEGSTVFSVAKSKPISFYNFTFQNDVFVGDDDGYTNGFGFTKGKGPFLEFSRDNLPWHLNFLTKNLYIQKMPNKVRGVAHMFFQRMQTPEDIEIVELQENDIPYAGFFAVQSTLFAWDKDRSDQLSLFLGFVGPITLAEESQKLVHKAIGSTEPLGWDNQLDNEPVIRIQARQNRKLYRKYGERFGFDVIGLGAVSIGTIRSDIQLGGAIRFGSNMEFSHATFNLQADRQVNSLALSPKNDFYTYVGGRVSLVANDILLDGNTFEDSHSAPLEHVRDQLSAGIVWKRNKLAYVFQLTSSSSPTTISDERESFGAVGITYPFL